MYVFMSQNFYFQAFIFGFFAPPVWDVYFRIDCGDVLCHKPFIEKQKKGQKLHKKTLVLFNNPKTRDLRLDERS